MTVMIYYLGYCFSLSTNYEHNIYTRDSQNRHYFFFLFLNFLSGLVPQIVTNDISVGIFIWDHHRSLNDYLLVKFSVVCCDTVMYLFAISCEHEWRSTPLIALIICRNMHRLISAATGRWVTSDPAELPFLPGRKKLCTSAVEYNP